jgi:hypothetical protein
MDELLTPAERRALDLTGELAGLFGEIVGNESSRHGDLTEIVSAIHILQRYLMSQAAARAYPGQYRALGEHIATSATTGPAGA